MNRDRLLEVVMDQKEAFNHPKRLIDRDVILEPYIESRLVVIISGIRRCGKSTLLYLIKEKMNLADADYCYFNFDDERILPDVSILDQIYNLHLEIHGKDPVLFFDEIQNISNWEKFVTRIYEKGLKVFVSGSNATLLSSEISTSLTGRNKILWLQPFSFSEYLRFSGNPIMSAPAGSRQKAMIRKDLNDYLRYGGFPLVDQEKDLELINGYFQDILYRDIISRYRLSQVREIRQIALYFASNTGKRFSYSALRLISGIKSLSSIKDYLWYYEQSYLFFYLRKFDYSVRTQMMNPKKVYAADPAISNRLGFNFTENKGRLLENVIFLELVRRGKEVFYYTGKNECDFLVKEGLRITQAIQVAWEINVENQKREIKGLEEAMEAFNLDRGVIITAEVPLTGQFPEKIKCISAWQWLLDNE